jgi:hypothetical protein
MSRQSLKNPLFKSIDWLEKEQFRKWFASWLSRNYHSIYADSFSTFDRKSYNAAFDGMAKSVKGLTPKLSKLTTAQQLYAIHSVASNWGLATSQKTVLARLKFELTHAKSSTCAATIASTESVLLSDLLMASPWAGEHASRELMWENFGRSLCRSCYPRSTDSQIALQRIILILSSDKISTGPRPPSPEVQALQLNLFRAVRVIYALESGVKRLSQSLVKTVKNWPRQPSGAPVILNAAKTRKLVSHQLGVARKQQTKPSSKDLAMRQAIESAFLIEDFRGQLFVLLHEEAERQRAGSTKVWQHMDASMRKAIIHACKPRSEQNQINRLLASNFDAIRRLGKMSVLEAEFKDEFPSPIPKKHGGPKEGQSSFDVKVRKGKRLLREKFGLDFGPACSSNQE